MFLVDFADWLKASRLRFNPAKAQDWISTSAVLDIVHVPILSSCSRVQETTRDLGVVIDSQLSVGKHVASVSRRG